MAINGNNIYICTVSGNSTTIIAGTKTNEIQTEAETIEISTPTSGQWRKYITKRKEWSFTVGFLLLQSSDVINLLQVGNEFNIAVVTREGNSPTTQLVGTAILKKAKHSYTRGKLAQGSWEFVGNSELAVPQSSGGSGGGSLE